MRNWARVAAKLQLIDAWLEEHRPGLVDEDGNLPGCMAAYVSLANAERLALKRLEELLAERAQGQDDWLDKYVVNADGDGDD